MSMSRSLPGAASPRATEPKIAAWRTPRMQLSLVLLQGSEGFVSVYTVYRKTATLTSFHSFRATSNPVALLVLRPQMLEFIAVQQVIPGICPIPYSAAFTFARRARRASSSFKYAPV